MNQVRMLMMALILSLGGMGAWVWKAKESQWEAEASANKAQEARRSLEVAKEAELKAALADQQAKHQADLAEIVDKHEKAIDELRKGERQRMAQAFSQFGDILDGNKKTLDYINLLEDKVKSGQAISKNEAQKLALIATGLGYLQKQYQKPFREFSELEAYLSKRADANIETPSMRFAFWKRLFSSEFREQEREFYRTEGERRGFQDASEKFSAAYAAAQKQMAAVDADFEKAIIKLNELNTDKKDEDLTQFFQQARKALTTHQKLLEFEPDTTKPATEGVRP